VLNGDQFYEKYLFTQ